MKLLNLAFAAAALAAVVAPNMANAQDIRVRVGGDRGMYSHDRGFHDHRAEFRGHRDRGWHRGWRNRDRVVIVKERRHRHWH